MENKENVILDKTFAFALKIIEFSELLEANRKFVIANQLLKSGTSIGANVHEAQSAESKADFIHKLKIADKEARETDYWLLLCKNSPSYQNPDVLIKDLKEILKILNAIIGSARMR
jgi:four helix bundle protein